MDQNGLSICNPKPQRLPGPVLLHHLVTSANDATAIEFLSDNEETSYSYKELHDASDHLCHIIESLFEGSEEPEDDVVIPLLIPQCPQLYISQLAVLKYGGAFCPLNIDAPLERIKFILKDVSAKVVLVTQQLAHKIPPECNVKVIAVDTQKPRPEPSSKVLRASNSERLAYVMYTSGSTGTPKGVGLTNSAATQALLAHDRHIPAFSRFLQFAAPTFDVSVFEIFFPLFRGSTLVSVNREEMLNDLPGTMRRMSVDACELTPTVAAGLLKRREAVPKLKLLLTIGEMLKMPVIQEFGGNDKRESLLWAMYGPTEATIHCTLQSSLPSSSSPGNIGLPLDTVSCFIIKPSESPGESEAFEILSRGTAGELAVGGFQIARGYINRPEQTSSVFIDSPYGRVYRTGDRAVMKPDGTIECLGRLSDGQVKLRGQRIELGEIEHAALRTLGCHGASAFVVDSQLILCCAVDQEVGEDDVLANCRSWLPQFMVPNEIVTMKEFPRLPSGKSDAKKLKHDFIQQKAENNMTRGTENEFSEQEAEVVGIVAATLSQPVNLNSVLNASGLDSLSAIRLVSALRRAGIDISVTKLLKLRTVADICSCLRRSDILAQQNGTDAPLPDFTSILDEHPVLADIRHLVKTGQGCTPLQSAMLAETEQNPSSYCNEMLFETSSNVTPSMLLQSFESVMQSNDILRTGFVHWKGQYVSVLFSTPLEGQITVRTETQNEFSLQIPADYLRPFRVQIIDHGESISPSILIHAHHAIYDGWSMDMILSDVSDICKGVIPAARPQFSHVLEFQGRITKEYGDESRAFWSNNLLGWNKIPFPKLVSQAKSNEILSHETFFEISPEVVQRVSTASGISKQVIFQGALALAWKGVIGNPDILLGSVVSGRTIPVDGIERILGPCIASMPLRVDISRMNSNMDVLKTIQASNRAVMEHCNLPLSDISKLAGLAPTESLYDVLFVYQQSLLSSDMENRILKQVRHRDRLETKLLVEVEPLKDGFAVQLTYHSASLTPEFVDLFAKQIYEFCQKILSNPMGPLVSSRDLDGLEMSIHREKSSVDDEPVDVAALFNTSMDRNPDAEALRFVSYSNEGEAAVATLSYYQLNHVANRTAHYIHNYGAKPGDIIAIMMSKSITLYTSILGIIKAGCAYLPIIPTTPMERVREMLRQSSAKICLVDDGVARCSVFPDTTSVANMDGTSLQSWPSNAPVIQPEPSRLAYVIFTSGTTGLPKGVAVSQRNLASNITYLNTVYPKMSRRPRLLQACSHAFDVSVFEIFYAWYAGMSLCAADSDLLFGDIEYWIRDLAITHLSLTPTVASLIDPKNVPQVEFLVTAGEPMTASVLEKWDNLLYQGYGPSETTNICSVKRMAKSHVVEHLGWVFPNTSAFVMAPDSLDVLPRGWVGEFCFGGSQVANGYLSDTDLTAMKFVEHELFGRVYRSGDMGRMLPDGSLIIMGRIDDQLKLRGQRIEAQEINGILTNTELVATAATMMVQNKTGLSDQLATFYRPSNATQTSEPMEVTPSINNMLFATLRTKLPSYMVPSYLIPVPYIPMTSSGKIDRSQCVNWFNSLSREYLENASATFQPSDDADGWTDIESKIAQAIVDTMQVSYDEVGRWTPFLSLGVDSISAIAVAKSLKTQLDYSVPISAILQNPTVAELGHFLSRSDNNTHADVRDQTLLSIASFGKEVSSAIGSELQNIDQILPCMPLQEAMLLHGQGSYYNRILLRLHVSPDDMHSYWQEMSKRHSILRTCFVTTMNSTRPIAQVILRQWDLPWRTFEVTAPSLEGASREHLDSLPNPLDSFIPPCSLALIRYRGSSFLSFICHHALYDGIAMENLWREVEAMAQGRQLQDAVPYLPFMQQALCLPVDVETFWRDQFSNFRASAAFGRSARSSINQCTNTVSIDMSLKEMQRRTRSFGVSLLAICQASWAAVLTCVFDEPDIAFGNVVSGRTIGVEGVDKLVAPCFNTVPLRMDTSQKAQNIDLVKAFQQLNSSLVPYQFSPLKLIQKVVETRRRQLFDTLFILQQPLKEMDKNVWTLEEDAGNMDVPIVCEVVPCPNLNSIVVDLHYDMDMITAELASTVLDMFKFMLRTMVELPFGPLPSRSTIPPAFSQSLLGLVIKRDKRENLDQILMPSGQWSNLELTVRKVIAGISAVSETVIQRDTTIFQVGLDSINAVQVASVLRSEGMSVSSSDVIECPSCLKLASRIRQNSERLNWEKVRMDFSSFQTQVRTDVEKTFTCAANIEAILPCTAVQNAMLVAFVHSTEAYYLNVLSFAVHDHINATSLQGAWKSLQDRHPMLRTGFVPISHAESTFAMVTHNVTSLTHPIVVLDASASQSFSVEDWKAECRKYMLSNLYEPPWKVALVTSGGQNLMHIIMHHALYDAQSLDGMFRGLSNLLKSEPCTFPGIEPALADILLRSKRETLEAESFWKAQAAKLVVNKFPIMTPLREPTREVTVKESISSLGLAELRELTKTMGISVQAVLQASWTRILAAYLGERSVAFGVVLAGRTTDLTADAPFPCLATVPIVADAEDSNLRLMENMMEYNSSLHKYQYKPLAQIQKWLGHPATPVFDTVLVYQKTGGSFSNTGLWELIADHPSVEYAVSLEVEPLLDDQLRLRLTTRSDILPQGQVGLLLQQFDAVLVHLLRQPNGVGNELYRTRQNLFSITPARIPVMDCSVEFVHQFVEKNAETQPNFPALEFVSDFHGTPGSRRTWTYKQLDEIGNQVAHLLSQVVDAGNIVAIHFHKCPEAYMSILGILKAGCSFVALDPSAPDARKSFILEDSKAVCLLALKDSVLSFAAKTPIIAIEEEIIRSLPVTRIAHGDKLTKSMTCYCLYTSGTTGTPKGCEITHENTVQAMMAFQHLFHGHWQNDSRWLQFAALHFDVSVLEQYWSWSVGITVVAAPKQLILDDLTGSINRMEITHIDLTPSLARLTRPEQLPNLCKGVFITGGEQLNQEILDAWGPKAVIYNAYGPTEATIGVTMYQRVPVNGRPSNIGQQFPNVGSYVFHAGTNIPVLRGGVGELCVSGKLVGKGYLHRPELTDQRFPTVPYFNERIYRTGDLVRILHDGCFDFLGRADDQVKLRGQRLEIGEINHIIRNNTPGVKDAATLVMRHGDKDFLVAFLVANEEKGSDERIVPDEDGLGAKARASCLDSLPGYMIPTYFIRLPVIPLSPNNKVEAKELKALFQNLRPEELTKLTGRDTTASGGQIDPSVLEAMIQILADFSSLPTSAISHSTSIFDVGVDSISALQLSTMFKNGGFIASTPAMVLRSPIVSDLARKFSNTLESTEKHDKSREIQQDLRGYQHRHGALVCRELRAKPEDIEYIVPCSPLQAGMISHAVAEPGTNVYFNRFDIQIADDIPMEVVRRAWEKTVCDHSILRSVFVKSTDGYIQVALRRTDSFWHCLDASDHGDIDDVLERAGRSWVADNASHILSPLQFIQVNGPDKRVLRLHIFHGLYDGNSLESMNEYAVCVYQSKTPPSGPSFFNALSHGPLRNFDFCKPYWTKHLDKWQHCSLPEPSPSHTRVSNVVSSSRRLNMDPLETLRRQQNVTLQTIVLAIWTIVLQQHFSKPLTIGIIVAGRSLNLPNVEHTVGPLFNTVPFFNRSLRGLSWEGLVRRCHEFNTDILSFQHVPLRDIQKWCSSNGKSLFNNLFTFQLDKAESSSVNLPWTITDNEPDSLDTADYPLAFEATKTRDGYLALRLVAHSHVADSEALQRMFSHFEHIVSTFEPDTIINSSAEDDDLGASTDLGSNASGAGASDHDAQVRLDWTPISLAIRDELCACMTISTEDTSPGMSILDLGIDSIDAIKISARLSKRNIRLSASQIMRHQTFSAIAAVATTQVDSAPEVSSNAALDNLRNRLDAFVRSKNVDMDNVEMILPSTALQESMIAGMVQSEFQWYFNHDILELGDEVGLTKLESAWSSLVELSPILRTGFIAVDDSDLDAAYCQVVYKRATARIATKELPDKSGLQDLIKEATETARQGEARNNLLQVTIVSAGQHNYMVISIAHALYDGWSLALLYQDLQTAYQAELLPRKFSDILMSQPLLYGASDQDGFWQTYLANTEPTMFERAGPCTQNSEPIHRGEQPSSKSLTAISSFCRGNSISLQSLCMACWAAVAAHMTHTLDTVFGVVLSGRDFEGAEELMFPCMNTVAIRSIIHADVSSFLKYMESNLADVRAHQGVPLRKAQAAAKVGVKQLFNSLFILQKSPTAQDASQPMWTSVDGTSAVEYPVCIETEPLHDQLHWRVACQSDIFSKRDSTDLLDKLDQVMNFFLDSPDADVLAFDGTGRVSVAGLPMTAMREQTYGSQIPAAKLNDEKTQAYHSSQTAQLIRQVLSEASSSPVESILPTLTLYHLGLDSISAIKVSLMLHKVNIDIRPRDLIQANSIMEIVKLAEDYREPPPENPSGASQYELPSSISKNNLARQCSISEQDVQLILPATPLQVHMMSAWQNSNGTVFYPKFCFEITGEFTHKQLLLAWERVVRRLAILRTRLVSTGDAELPWVQVVTKSDSATDDHASNASHPLWRASAHQVNDNGTWLFQIDIHHALYDGFSLPKLMQLFYEEMHNTDGTTSPTINTAGWEHHAILPTLPASLESRKQFWTSYLLDSSSTYHKPANPSTIPYSDQRVSYLRRQAVPDTHDLQTSASSQGLSLQSLFLAAYARTLLVHSEGEATSDAKPIIFGIYLANRDLQSDTLDPTYPTLNLVPLRVTLAPEDDLLSVAKAVQKDLQLIQSNDRARVGLWEIYHWTGVQVHTFVNFLSLLDEGAEAETPGLVRSVSGDSLSTDATELLNQPWLQNNVVREAYPASIDIEASVHGNSLDIGIFGSTDSLSDDDAPRIVDDIVQHLLAA